MGRIIVASTMALATLLVGCVTVFPGSADCEWRTVDDGEARAPRVSIIRPAPLSANSCAQQVEVNGRVYTVGVGRWLDEDALELVEFGPITRSIGPVDEPIAWALDGVDPARFLVMRGDGVDDLGEMGPWMALWGSGDVPPSVCRYVELGDPQSPAECAAAP
jgi:hypothetical protein